MIINKHVVKKKEEQWRKKESEKEDLLGKENKAREKRTVGKKKGKLREKREVGIGKKKGKGGSLSRSLYICNKNNVTRGKNKRNEEGMMGNRQEHDSKGKG